MPTINGIADTPGGLAGKTCRSLVAGVVRQSTEMKYGNGGSRCDI